MPTYDDQGLSIELPRCSHPSVFSVFLFQNFLFECACIKSLDNASEKNAKCKLCPNISIPSHPFPTIELYACYRERLIRISYWYKEAISSVTPSAKRCPALGLSSLGLPINPICLVRLLCICTRKILRAYSRRGNKEESRQGLLMTKHWRERGAKRYWACLLPPEGGREGPGWKGGSSCSGAEERELLALSLGLPKWKSGVSIRKGGLVPKDRRRRNWPWCEEGESPLTPLPRPPPTGLQCQTKEEEEAERQERTFSSPQRASDSPRLHHRRRLQQARPEREERGIERKKGSFSFNARTIAASTVHITLKVPNINEKGKYFWREIGLEFLRRVWFAFEV